MLAVIKTGGKQYLVRENDILKIEKIDGKIGQTISFNEILLLIDEKNKKIQMGRPVLKAVKIKAKILEQNKNKKILVIKYKAKTRYRRKRGHRQPYIKVRILEISTGK